MSNHTTHRGPSRTRSARARLPLAAHGPRRPRRAPDGPGRRPRSGRRRWPGGSSGAGRTRPRPAGTVVQTGPTMPEPVTHPPARARSWGLAAAWGTASPLGRQGTGGAEPASRVASAVASIVGTRNAVPRLRDCSAAAWSGPRGQDVPLERRDPLERGDPRNRGSPDPRFPSGICTASHATAQRSPQGSPLHFSRPRLSHSRVFPFCPSRRRNQAPCGRQQLSGATDGGRSARQRRYGYVTAPELAPARRPHLINRTQPRDPCRIFGQ